MPYTLPTETVPAIYAPDTRAAIQTLLASTEDFVATPFAEQIIDPRELENIHSGNLEFASGLDHALTPPVARALVLDREMRDLIRRIVRDMRPSLEGPGLPVVNWFPNAVGIFWHWSGRPECRGCAIRVSSRLILTAAASSTDALNRRFEFDATIRGWNEVLRQDLHWQWCDPAPYGMVPPHLDCLLIPPPHQPSQSAPDEPAECDCHVDGESRNHNGRGHVDRETSS